MISLPHLCIILADSTHYPAQIRVKQEQVNDEMRVKCTVANLAALDFVAESRQMIDAINKYN